MELHGLPGGRSEHELQLHRAGKKHWANAAAVEARIKAIGALKAAKPKKRRLQYKPADQENEANIKEKSTEFNEVSSCFPPSVLVSLQPPPPTPQPLLKSLQRLTCW